MDIDEKSVTGRMDFAHEEQDAAVTMNLNIPVTESESLVVSKIKLRRKDRDSGHNTRSSQASRNSTDSQVMSLSQSVKEEEADANTTQESEDGAMLAYDLFKQKEEPTSASQSLNTTIDVEYCSSQGSQSEGAATDGLSSENDIVLPPPVIPMEFIFEEAVYSSLPPTLNVDLIARCSKANLTGENLVVFKHNDKLRIHAKNVRESQYNAPHPNACVVCSRMIEVGEMYLNFPEELDKRRIWGNTLGFKYSQVLRMKFGGMYTTARMICTDHFTEECFRTFNFNKAAIEACGVPRFVASDDPGFRTPTKKVPWICTICDEEHVSVSDLHKHLLDHVDDKKEEMDDHVKAIVYKRKGKGFMCPYCRKCTYGYKTTGGFRRHLLTKPETHCHLRRIAEIARGSCRLFELEPVDRWESWTERNVYVAYHGLEPPPITPKTPRKRKPTGTPIPTPAKKTLAEGLEGLKSEGSDSDEQAPPLLNAANEAEASTSSEATNVNETSSPVPRLPKERSLVPPERQQEWDLRQSEKDLANYQRLQQEKQKKLDEAERKAEKEKRHSLKIPPVVNIPTIVDEAKVAIASPAKPKADARRIIGRSPVTKMYTARVVSRAERGLPETSTSTSALNDLKAPTLPSPKKFLPRAITHMPSTIISTGTAPKRPSQVICDSDDGPMVVNTTSRHMDVTSTLADALSNVTAEEPFMDEEIVKQPLLYLGSSNEVFRYSGNMERTVKTTERRTQRQIEGYEARLRLFGDVSVVDIPPGYTTVQTDRGVRIVEKTWRHHEEQVAQPVKIPARRFLAVSRDGK